ncbi:MAG: tetratricopeptide repeat protein [Lentisphaeraceae bacterium]|nr:tetratricopeptide repeat protein [Lentisphaeraceae bacterium]
MFKFFLFFTLSVSALLADDSARLEKANTLFEKASKAALSDPDKSKKFYKEAILNYQFLIDEQGYSSPELFTNTGNAYFFSGDLGLAIVNYQKALRLEPGNSDVLHNLKFVRAQVIDELPESMTEKVVRTIFFWHSWSLECRIVFFALFNLVLWSLLGLNHFKTIPRFTQYVFSSLFICLLMGTSLGVTISGWDNGVDGVITEKEVIARQGNGHIYEPAFMTPLHSGTEFSILDSRENWLYVELLDGSKCWLPKQSLTFID